MFLIDTNIHAAYLLQNFEDDKLTKEYLVLYDKIALADRLVPDFIIGEFETFIMQVVPSRYHLNANDKKILKQVAMDYIHRLTDDCTIIVPRTETVNKAQNIYFKNSEVRYLSFIDCLILAIAEENKYTIFTKDVRLQTIASQLNIPLLKPENK